MGMMRFVSPHFALSEQQREHAYLAGPDRLPIPSEGECNEHELGFEFPGNRSAVLQLPWPIEGTGLVAFVSATLQCQSRPYFLPLELARGKIGQLRNLLTEWQLVGLEPSKHVVEAIDEAVACFAQAAVLKHDEPRSSNLAAEALELAFHAGLELATEYGEQAIAVRQGMAQRLPLFLAADLGAVVPRGAIADALLDTFNMAAIDAGWRHTLLDEDHLDWERPDAALTWCREHRVPRTMGPLLRFDRQGLPNWLAERNAAELVQQMAIEYMESVVRQYRGRMSMWELCGAVNMPLGFDWDQESAANFVARCIQIMRTLDPGSPIVLSLRQPWCEELRWQACEFSGPVLADAFVRADLGLSGIILDLQLGYAPGGTLLRDPLDLSRQLDYWAMIADPLYVRFCAPSSTEPDLLATGPARPVFGDWTPQLQADWTRRYLTMIISKPYIHGIFWSPLRDTEPHEFPHGGLFDTRRQPKPSCETVRGIRGRLQ